LALAVLLGPDLLWGKQDNSPPAAVFLRHGDDCITLERHPFRDETINRLGVVNFFTTGRTEELQRGAITTTKPVRRACVAPTMSFVGSSPDLRMIFFSI
jgi:hypothetical protein